MSRKIGFIRAAAAIAGGTLVILSTGCSQLTDTGAMQNDMNLIKINQDKLNAKTTDGFSTQQKQLDKILDQLNAQEEMLKAMRGDLERQIREIRGGLPGGGLKPGATSFPPQTGATTTTTATPAEDEVLRQIAEMFARGEYDKVIENTSKFLVDYPDSPNAPEAILRMGICYFHQGKYKQSLDTCNMMIAKYPSSPLVPRAYHTKGSCEIQMNNKPAARETFTRLRASFPDYEREKMDNIFTNYLDKK